MNDQRVMVSLAKDDDTFIVSVGACSIEISELRVRPMSNKITPHQVLGKGKSVIALTDRQLCELVAEYLRYRLGGNLKYSQEDVSFSFSCEHRE